MNRWKVPKSRWMLCPASFLVGKGSCIGVEWGLAPIPLPGSFWDEGEGRIGIGLGLGKRRIGILGAGSDSGGPHGPRGGRDRIRGGRIGLGGLDPPSGASPASLKPVCYRGDPWLLRELGRPFGGREYRQPRGPKKFVLIEKSPPCPPPCNGGFWAGWGRRPFTPSVLPLPLLPPPRLVPICFERSLLPINCELEDFKISLLMCGFFEYMNSGETQSTLRSGAARLRAATMSL